MVKLNDEEYSKMVDGMIEMVIKKYEEIHNKKISVEECIKLFDTIDGRVKNYYQ